MTQEEIKYLEKLLLRHGAFKVVQCFSQICKDSCQTQYANNQEAVIHRDSAVLEEATHRMMLNHPIRMGVVRNPNN